MVRNDRLKKTGESTKLIAEFVEERRRAKSLTKADCFGLGREDEPILRIRPIARKSCMDDG